MAREKWRGVGRNDEDICTASLNVLGCTTQAVVQSNSTSISFSMFSDCKLPWNCGVQAKTFLAAAEVVFPE
jgi:hypothetical protein